MDGVGVEWRPMKVVAHLDPVVLEGELLRRIGEVQERNGKTAPVLVVVPTSRLRDHLQRRLAEKFGAVLGVEIVHFHGLARMIHEASETGATEPASSRVLTELLRRCIGELPNGNRLKEYVRQRPGAATSLMSSIRDLREAGVDPELFRDLPGAAPHLTALYERYCHRLTGLSELGITDEAGYIAAAGNASGIRNRFHSVFLYGAYELVGVHLNLLRKLQPVTVLTSCDAAGEAPAGSYAHSFAERFFLAPGETMEAAIITRRESLLATRLSALYNEESTPERLPLGTITLEDFQGPSHEASWAVRRALALGGDPKEICILARDLNRYAPFLVDALGKLEPDTEEHRIWTGSLSTPLRRDPVVHDAMVLLKAVAGDFPRTSTVELLSSPRILWHVLMEEPEDLFEPPDGPAADRWSRSAGILSDFSAWKRSLPAEAGRFTTWNIETEAERKEAVEASKARIGQAERIVIFLESIKDRFDTDTPGTWSGQAERLRLLLQLLPRHAALENLLKEMELLDCVTADTDVTAEQAVSWMETAIDGVTDTLSSDENGGIRVLDFMQARGLTFSQVVLLGFHTGSFPRIPRPDPFLGEAVRQAIASELGVPIPGLADGGEEEHLLLALMLGAAGNQIHLSWQRADDTGRSVSPSPALREVARVTMGRPDTRSLLKEQVDHHAVHPEGRLAELAGTTNMLSPWEARTLSAFSIAGYLPDDPPSAELLELDGGTIAMLRAVEQYSFGDPSWDGRIGPGFTPPDRAWSATALDTLGNCPLRFFFQKILKVEELEEEVSPLDLAARDLGIAVHTLLEKVYLRLQDEGVFQEAARSDPTTRGLELVERHWEEAFSSLRSKVDRRLAPLYNIRESHWRRAVEAFIRVDLATLKPPPFLEFELESYATREIELPDKSKIQLGGRFDRVARSLEDNGTTIITDYKTSGNLKDRLNPTYMLKGDKLQVPVYHLLKDNLPAVELLGVGPDFRPEEENRNDFRFTGFKGDEASGMLETLGVLTRLIGNGVFPLWEKSPSCRYCVFKPACRINHPPTLERESSSVDSADFRLLKKKTSKKPHIKDLQ